MTSGTSKSWRCVVCGYIHHGDAPPDECPICGAPASDFEPFEEAHAVHAAPAVSGPAQIVIVGGGIAAVSAAEAARRTSADAKITLVSREPELPYYRINLTRFLAGEIEASELILHPAAWYEKQNIGIRTGAVVESVGPKQIRIRDGAPLPFDKLILATGANAFLPPTPGTDRNHVMTLRTIEDAQRLVEALRPGLKCVCIGGGILGLETAGALTRRGAVVTLLEGHPYLMPRQLSRRAGEIMKGFVEGIGIQLRTEARTKEITEAGVLLERGETLPADLILFTTGVRSNTNLAQQAGLTVNNGIVVDNHLQTTNPDIFAAGDSAEHNRILYGSWAAAQHQGSIAGMNAAGAQVEFGGIPRSHTLKVLGLNMTSVGKFEPEDDSNRVIEDEQGTRYQRFVFRDGRLVGAILMGDTSLTAAASKAIESGSDFSGCETIRAIVDRLGNEHSDGHRGRQ